MTDTDTDRVRRASATAPVFELDRPATYEGGKTKYKCLEDSEGWRDEEWLLNESILFQDQDETQTRERKYTLFPIQHDVIWEDFYKKHQSTYWTAEELDLGEDVRDWKSLTDNERHYLKHVLAFFAASDAIVNENLLENFSREIQPQEARSFYTVQAMMETIHSETYSLLIETYIQDSQEKQQVFDALHTFPSVRDKGQWMLDWTDASKASFAERLVAFAVAEGIFFSGSFCAIFFMKKRGLMPGLCFSNELISRDENLHCEFACYLYKQLKHKLPPERVYEIFDNAIRLEHRFVTESLPVDLIGMNAKQMRQYILYVADYWLEELGVPKLYHATQPFPWMDMISLNGKTNFFEKRVGEYAKAGVGLRTHSQTKAGPSTGMFDAEF